MAISIVPLERPAVMVGVSRASGLGVDCGVYVPREAGDIHG